MSWASASRLGEVFVQVQAAGDGAGDLGDLEGVREAGHEVVADGGDEDLGLVLEAAEGLAVDDAVAVALERGAYGRGLFGGFAASGLVRFRGVGRQGALALLEAQSNGVKIRLVGQGYLEPILAPPGAYAL